MKMKKALIGAAVVIPAVFLLLFINSLTGNPVSKALAKRTAEHYINQNYSQLELRIESVYYNFKFGEYRVIVQSETSEDTAFSICFDSFGTVTGDDYATEVANSFTTWRRLSGALRSKGAEIIGNQLDYDFAFTYIRFAAENSADTGRSKLQLDMTLDIYAPPLPLEADVAVFTDNLSYDKIAEVAKTVEATLKAQNVPIAQYSVRLIPLSNKPLQEKEAVSWANSIAVDGFPAERMSEEYLPQAMAQFEQQLYSQTTRKPIRLDDPFCS